VATGTGDTTAAAIGAGAVRDYRGHLYIGTSAWLSCHVPFKRTDVLHNVASLPAVVPGRYWIATIQDVAGKAVDWLIDNVVYAQDGMLDAHPVAARRALTGFNALAVSAPPGSSNGVIFAPVAERRAHPGRRSRRAGRVVKRLAATPPRRSGPCGLRGDRADTRWMKETVERFASRELDGGFRELTFIGGGANSALWCQTLADILGLHDQAGRAAGARQRARRRHDRRDQHRRAVLGRGPRNSLPSRRATSRTAPGKSRYDQQYRAFRDLYRGYSRHPQALQLQTGRPESRLASCRSPRTSQRTTRSGRTAQTSRRATRRRVTEKMALSRSIALLRRSRGTVTSSAARPRTGRRAVRSPAWIAGCAHRFFQSTRATPSSFERMRE